MKRLILLSVPLALAACGQTAPLRPQAGDPLPPKPLAARTTPDAETLIAPSDQSRPKRTDDVLQSSEKRAPDKFDLPPSR